MIIAINASAKGCRDAKIAHELFIIIYTYFRTKKAKSNNPYLVYLHWQFSLNRYKVSIGAYVFCFLVTSLALIISTDVNAGCGEIDQKYPQN